MKPREFVSELFSTLLALVLALGLAMIPAFFLTVFLGWENARWVIVAIAGTYLAAALGRDSWTPWRRALT